MSLQDFFQCFHLLTGASQFHKKFVEEEQWIDEQTYQELFAVCQALPVPASTKMLYCINSIHGGWMMGILSFALWSLPGALGMYGLSLGISQVGDRLPAPVYALLSGLNSVTVGIIALAAVQLAEKAITDKITRMVVCFGGAAGILYSSLWYFPLLMVAGGLATVTWDLRLAQKALDWAQRILRSRDRHHQEGHSVNDESVRIESQDPIIQQPSPIVSESNVQLRRARPRQGGTLPVTETTPSQQLSEPTNNDPSHPANQVLSLLTWKRGLLIIVFFIASFVAVLTLRGLLSTPPRGFSLFANLYLAGTIIFGGGPVVIPLLREYIVAEGWVSARDFLLGLAVIQAFPGPNFNFAVYLGSLTAANNNTSLPTLVGALIAFVAIFAPGVIIVSGAMGFWKELRSRRWLVSLLRGVNAAAVGLVYTAVYRLWQIGLLDEMRGSGSPLGGDPWWVAITATSFVGGRWFGLSAPLAILLGGALGVVWYAVVRA
ncbi:hypothetical protein Daus18300_008195 [Diaporthe australafricana]|uniref:Chromate transporter n=1 Tax=Diaporthe australafricana TaxID=127596 RepID=A0ABR3WJG4_9PEZI